MEESLLRLLRTERSYLAGLVTVGLRSFVLCLRMQMRLPLGDPGLSACREVVDALEKILGEIRPKAPPAPPEDGFDFDLEPHFELTESEPKPDVLPVPRASLRAVLERRSALAESLAACGPQSLEGVELWARLNLWFLRLPQGAARSGREAALDAASAAGIEPAPERVHRLPGLRDELVYPGLRGGLEADGLSLQVDAPLDARLEPSILHSQGPGEIRDVAKCVSQSLYLLQRDESLHHALAEINRFSVAPLARQQDVYAAVLIRRFSTYARATDAEARLRALIEVDEAIHCLIHDPLEAPGSWWEKLRKASRRLLFINVDKAVATGVRAFVQELSGAYANVHAASRDNLERDQGGSPGEVLVCLRVFAEVGGTALPGRVLYRAIRI